MQKPLRILIVVDLEWDIRLGAIRVFMGLTDAWCAAGHTVAKYCLTDAYPAPTSSRFFSVFRQLFFPWKAAAFVRRNHDRFDVIDSLLGTLPFPKKRLRFAGLLVARSVGFYRLYQDFERTVLKRWPNQPRGKLSGRIFYRFVNKMLSKASRTALRNSDLLNLPNDEELRSLRKEIGSDKPALVQPYGLTVERRRELFQAAAPAAERLSKKKVSFIGMWSPRKGANDWGEIIRLVRATVPDARF